MWFKRRCENAIAKFAEELDALNEIIQEIQCSEQELNTARKISKDIIMSSADLIGTISHTPPSFESDYRIIESSINSDCEVNNIESITHQLHSALNISDILLTCSAAGLSILGLSSVKDNDIIRDENKLYEDSLESQKSFPQDNEISEMIADSDLETEPDDDNQSIDIKKILACILAALAVGALISRCIMNYNTAKKVLSEAENIIHESSELKKYLVSLQEHIEKTNKTATTLRQIIEEVKCHEHANFIELPSDDQKRICDLFNLTVGLSKELQVIVEVPK